MRVSSDFAEWVDAPLAELLDHITERYVRPLPRTVARVEAALREARAPVGTRELLTELGELAIEHVRREEDLVCPWLRTRNRASAAMLVAMLEREHRRMTRSAGALRAQLPRGVLGRLAVDRSLAELDRLLHGHIALEDEVLFPRALASNSNDV
jgi:iron-sulfur cluster repair protein YtfE (RIC family)